jgi:hypothetical protein
VGRHCCQHLPLLPLPLQLLRLLLEEVAAFSSEPGTTQITHMGHAVSLNTRMNDGKT